VSPSDLVLLGDERVVLDTVARVARGGARVALTEKLRSRLAADRAVVERLAREDVPIYGLTTGLGAASDTRLGAGEIEAFQRRAILGRSVGVGSALPREAVRATLFCRAAGFAHGGSGISPAVIEAWIAMLNASVHPVIPCQGSLGAADLAPLSHAALPLLGLGAAEFEGTVLPGAEALRHAGLAPATLGPRDGHALIAHNAASVGLAALAALDASALLDVIDGTSTLALEGFRGNPSPFDPRCLAARGAPGQAEATGRLTRLLAGSELWRAGVPRRLQDPLSFRCIAPVHGAAREALARLREAIEVELNAAEENPVLIADDGVLLANANFDLTALALALEGCGLALAQVAVLAAQRMMKLMSPASSDLPRFLTRYHGTHAGFAPVQKTIAVLEAEIRHLANPVSLAPLAVADGVEDYAPMTFRVAEKTGEIIRRLRRLAAAELIVAAQAIDLRGDVRLGPPLRSLYDRVRAQVPPLEDDRPLGPEIEALAEAIEEGAFGTT
jgi:histidine ammonia-lyase